VDVRWCSFGLFVALFGLVLAAESNGFDTKSQRQRTCCPYAFNSSSKAARNDLCSSASSCILTSGNGLASPPLSSCQISSDSKRYKDDLDVCLDLTFPGLKAAEATEASAENKSNKGHLRRPWRITPYIVDIGYVLPAVALKVDYKVKWDQLYFRILDTDLCGAGNGSGDDDSVNNEYCNPRCVTVDRNPNQNENAGNGDDSNSEFMYDCEVGFYSSKTRMTTTTSGHTYSLDICLFSAADATSPSNESLSAAPTCGSYLFRIPRVSDIQASDFRDLILLDKRSLLNEQTLDLYFPKHFEDKQEKIFVQLLKVEGQHDDDADTVLVEDFEVETLGQGLSGDSASFPIGGHLDKGVYEVAVKVDDGHAEVVVARFELNHEDLEAKSASVWVTIGLVIFTLVTLGVYFKYLCVKKFQKVDPAKMYGNESSKAPCVLVMSNVDNRQHVDVILQFNDYLKTNCNVSEVYFAKDPKNGISSQAEGDPWRWAQEATAKVADSGRNGFILILGAPPHKMSLDIYKDFTKNQAFVSTQALCEMDEKKRVCVAMFPYCESADSLPSVIPDHLKKSRLSLPKEMNKLLCAIHNIKSRPIFSWIPIPYTFVQPDVCHSDLSKSPMGKELLKSISELQENVEAFKKQSESLYKTEEEEEAMPLNKVQMATMEEAKPNMPDLIATKKAGATEALPLVVQIESKTMSLGCKYLEGRDPNETTEG